MAKIIVCSAAEVDFTASLTWYAERSTAAANNFDAEFDRALKQIALDPIRWPRFDHRYRYFVMRGFPFRVIFRLIGEDVVVVAVAHGARAAGYWLDR